MPPQDGSTDPDLTSLLDDLRSGYRRIAGEDGPSEQEVIEALRTLQKAATRVFDAVVESGKDQAVREHLVNAVGWLGSAATTFATELASSMPSDDGGRRSA